MTQISRREALSLGFAAAAMTIIPAVAKLAPVPAAITPKAPTPSWIVGTPGEYDWYHIVAKTQRDALLERANDNGMFEEECSHEDYQEDCECCEAIACFEADRMPQWDGKDKIHASDWLAAGWGHTCSRCSHETSSDEGYPVGAEAVCEDCMQLADWEIVDPKRAAELRADLEG